MEINYDEELKQSRLQFLYTKEQLNSILNCLKQYGKVRAIRERKAGMYKFLKNLHDSLNVMLELSDAKSVASFLTLNRMIIDHYSIFYLITCNSSEEERNIRYYLFLIDGIKTRTNVVKDFEAAISENLQEFNKEKREDILASDQKSILQLETLISNINANGLVSERIIKDCNWKFIDSKSLKPLRDNSYSWVKLYYLARIPKKYSDAFQKYYSSYVHGLGTTLMSNTDYDSKPIIASSLYLTSIIQGLIIKILMMEHANELKFVSLEEKFKNYINLNWNSWK